MAETNPYGVTTPKRMRTHHIQQMKDAGQKITMLTSYDMLTAQIFNEAGIHMLLVGDSAANNVYGHDTTLPVTVDEMIPLVRAVSMHSTFSLVVADLPFGSYQVSTEQAVETSIRMMKEAGAHAVKLEGGVEYADRIKAIVQAGIPVVAHIGFTPQSEHTLGGYRVQGRGSAQEKLLEDALAVQEAGAFAVVLEMIPTPAAKEVTEKLAIPTIGIGAGNVTDGQVLVWQDMMGLRTGRLPRFVKVYANLHDEMLKATREYKTEVESQEFPDAEHSFEE
ncbi:MAG: 3-methyl-2-oxobutanoate hydroxymethyltransferase [Micrococcaceae bacterium]